MKKFKKVFSFNSLNNVRFLSACLGESSGDYILCTDENKYIYLYKRGRVKPINVFKSQSISTSLLLSEEKRLYLAGSQGGLITVFDLHSGNKPKVFLTGHSTSITAMSISKHFENTSILKEPIIFNNMNNKYSVSCDDSILCSGALDGKIKVWDIRTKYACVINVKGHSLSIKDLSISPDLNYLSSTSEDKTVRIWDLRNEGEFVKEINSKNQEREQGITTCILFNPYTATVMYGSNDKYIRSFDIDNYDLMFQTPIDKMPIKKCQFINGEMFYSGTNSSARLYSVSTDENSLSLSKM